jgi:hypothetical protein
VRHELDLHFNNQMREGDELSDYVNLFLFSMTKIVFASVLFGSCFPFVLIDMGELFLSVF